MMKVIIKEQRNKESEVYSHRLILVLENGKEITISEPIGTSDYIRVSMDDTMIICPRATNCCDIGMIK